MPRDQTNEVPMACGLGVYEIQLIFEKVLGIATFKFYTVKILFSLSLRFYTRFKTKRKLDIKAIYYINIRRIIFFEFFEANDEIDLKFEHDVLK